jgi:hypothetical protein
MKLSRGDLAMPKLTTLERIKKDLLRLKFARPGTREEKQICFRILREIQSLKLQLREEENHARQRI